MASYKTGSSGPVSSGTVAGVGGTMNAIPFLNVLAPGITAGFAQAGKDAILQDMLANVNNLEVPKLGGEYGQAAYTGDFNPNAYADPEAAQ